MEYTRNESDEQAEEEQISGEANGFGIRLVDAPLVVDRRVWLWPESLESWAMWISIQTQWRIGGMGGRTGLDYAAVTEFLRAHGFAHKRRKSLRVALGDVQAMEGAALRAWAEQAARDK